VVVEAVVAGVERHELAGGEVVRARNEDGDTVRFGASGEARGELRVTPSTRTRPRDHLVTGRAPATRAGGGAVGCFGGS